MKKLVTPSIFLISALSATAFGEEMTVSGPKTMPCPANFHSVSIPDDARQCQLFDTELPATMVYFTPHDKASVIAYYQAAIAGLQERSTFNERTLLSAKGESIRIVVSPDGEGTQVDILVNSPTS